MFTGIVTDVGEVLAVVPRADDLRRITIACAYDRASIVIGASICCSGICLTAIEIGQKDGRTWFMVDTAAETLRMTTAGRWRAGTRLNLERSLRVGDELGGHFMLGHVDGVAQVLEREDLTDSARIGFRAPADLSRFIATKGSVALDGVSLTVNDVRDSTFSVTVIPHTLQVTTFGSLRAGDRVNIEADTMARYAARLADVRQ
jgi:riboflavin synthase